MPLAKCVRRCWDSQLTRRYWPGDQDDLSSDNPLVKAGCFQFMEKVEYRLPEPPKVEPEPVRAQTVVIPEVHPDENPPEPKKK